MQATIGYIRMLTCVRLFFIAIFIQIQAPIGVCENVSLRFDTLRFDDKSLGKLVRKCAQRAIALQGETPVSEPTFQSILTKLDASATIFHFTTDTTWLQSEKETLGAIVAKGDTILIVVPEHERGSKRKLLELFGGHRGLVAEEVYHALQYEQGKIIADQHGLSATEGLDEITLDVEAKHFAARSGLALMQTMKYYPENSIPTLMGLIHSMQGDQKKIRQLLVYGMSMDIPPKGHQEGRITVHYRGSYD